MSAYLSDLLLGHALFHVSFVEKNQETGSHEPLYASKCISVDVQRFSEKDGMFPYLFQEQTT